jgi:hypothetical protein
VVLIVGVDMFGCAVKIVEDVCKVRDSWVGV